MGNKLLQLSPWILIILLIKQISKFTPFMILIIGGITILPYIYLIVHKNKIAIKSLFSKQVEHNPAE